MLQEVEAVDRSDEAAVRATMRWPGHDPASDRRVIVDSERQGQLIAHALAWKGDHEPAADVAVAVHPDWRRRGIGAALLARAVDRARAMGATAVRIYADEQHPAREDLYVSLLMSGMHWNWIRTAVPSAVRGVLPRTIRLVR